MRSSWNLMGVNPSQKIVDGTDHDVMPGDSWCIGSDVPHSARAVEDSVAVEKFSPS